MTAIQTLGGGTRRHWTHLKSVRAVVKQTDREHKASECGLRRLVQVSQAWCVCVCTHVMVWTVTNTPTCGGWVWLSSSSRQGKISEKEDQWASQLASYGGLKTFHDLRDARPCSNRLYSVSARIFASPYVQFCALPFFFNAPVPYLLTGTRLSKISRSSQFKPSRVPLIKNEQTGDSAEDSPAFCC